MLALSATILLLTTWWIWRAINRRIYHDLFSPFNLLFYFWIAPFILDLAELSSLQTGLAAEPAMIIILSTTILVAISLVPAAMIRRKRMRDFRIIDNERISPQRAGILIFFGITIVALYFAEYYSQEVPLIVYLLGDASNSNLHSYGKDSKLQVIAFGIYSAAILIFYLWINGKNSRHRTSLLVICILIVLLGLFKASKSDIYIPIISYAGIIYYHYRTTQRTLPRAYKIGAIFIAAIAVSITSIRLEGVGLTEGYAGLIRFKYADILGSTLSEMISIVYGYTALGFQNFSNYVVTHRFEFHLGTSLLRPFLSMLMLGSVADSIGVPVDQWNVVSDAANTGTFLTPLYIEGGFLFCLIGSLVYASMVNIIYFKFRSTRTTNWMLIYISVLFPWTWFFFTNAFSVLSIFVNMFYVAILSWLFLKKRRVPKINIEPTAQQIISP